LNRVFKIVIVTFLLLLFVAKANAGGLEKGFEALKIHDYFKAKATFYKFLKKDSSAAAYGLSVIYSRNNNPFHNLDSALLYSKLSMAIFFGRTSEKKKKKYQLLDVDSSSIKSQQLTVDAKCFAFAEEKKTVEAYDYFLYKNEGALEIEQAVINRSRLAYNIARGINSSQAYRNFMDIYPKAEQGDEINARYQKRLFKEYTTDGTIESNVKFIREQPDNFYVTEAQKNIYKLATKDNTITAYTDFINTYSNNPGVPRAWRNIYNISTQVRTSKNIKNFLNKYPDYPFKDELEEDYILSNMKYYPIKRNNKWGFVNEDLKVVIPIIYGSVSEFHEGAATAELNGKMGFINKKNVTLISFEYEEVEPFKNGLAVVGNNDKYGIINRFGETIVPLMYDDIGVATNEFISVELDDKCGFIDRKGDLKLGLQYETVGDFDNGIAYVKQNGLFGIIDTNLLYVVEPNYQWIDNLKDDFIRVQERGFFGVINPEGDYIAAPVYDQITEVENGFSMAVTGGEYVYLKPNGEAANEKSFPYFEGVIDWGGFDEHGYARVMVKGKFGLIDATGKRFVSALFEDIGHVSSEMIAVKRHNKWGYCDYKTKLIIPYNFDYAGHFIGDYAVVQKESLYGLINKKGSYVIEPIYEEIYWFHDQVLLVKENGLYGLINLDETIVLPIQYEKVEFSEDKKMLRLYSKDGFDYKLIESVFEE
jgi:hypothetical protein